MRSILEASIKHSGWLPSSLVLQTIISQSCVLREGLVKGLAFLSQAPAPRGVEPFRRSGF